MKLFLNFFVRVFGNAIILVHKLVQIFERLIARNCWVDGCRKGDKRTYVFLRCSIFPTFFCSLQVPSRNVCYFPEMPFEKSYVTFTIYKACGGASAIPQDSDMLPGDENRSQEILCNVDYSIYCKVPGSGLWKLSSWLMIVPRCSISLMMKGMIDILGDWI